MQVRLGYLGLLLAGTVGPLWPIHVVQFAGVGARLVADDCPLARLLILLPCNRAVPLGWPLVRALLLSPPSPGPIVDRISQSVCAHDTEPVPTQRHNFTHPEYAHRARRR